MVNHLVFYGLTLEPFAKNSIKTSIKITEQEEIKARLNTMLKVNGFGLVVGEPGTGKTTSVRDWSLSLSCDLYKSYYSCLSRLSIYEFYKHIARTLNLEPCFRKTDNHRLIQREINRLHIEKNITPVIILDEADYLSKDVLNELKIMFNFDMDSRDRVILILIGHTNLIGTLKLVQQEALAQRILISFKLEKITKSEAMDYIIAKLKYAKCNTQIFDESALEVITNYSDGKLRNIDKICHKSLIYGANLNANVINSEIVLSVIEDSCV